MTAEGSLASLADELGVSAEALSALGVKRNGSGWTWPERDADGDVIGIGKRLDDGRKLMERGSKRGLILPSTLHPYDATSSDQPLLVVEGMTDTAAGLTLGFVTVGRPSATGGLDYLRSLLRGRYVVIVAENDQAGRSGARRSRRGWRTLRHR